MSCNGYRLHMATLTHPPAVLKHPTPSPGGKKKIKNKKNNNKQKINKNKKQKNKLADRKVKPEIFVCQKKFCIQSTKGLQIEYGVSIDMKQRANSQGLFSYNKL